MRIHYIAVLASALVIAPAASSAFGETTNSVPPPPETSIAVGTQSNVPPPPANKPNKEFREELKMATDHVDTVNSVAGVAGWAGTATRPAKGLSNTLKFVDGSINVSNSVEGLMRGDQQPLYNWGRDVAFDKAAEFGCGIVGGLVTPEYPRLGSTVCETGWKVGKVVEPWLTDPIYDNFTRPLLGQPDLKDPAFWDKMKEDHRARMEARKAQNAALATTTPAPLVTYDSGSDDLNRKYYLDLLSQAQQIDPTLTHRINKSMQNSQSNSIKEGQKCPSGTSPGYVFDETPRLDANGHFIKPSLDSLRFVCSPTGVRLP